MPVRFLCDNCRGLLSVGRKKIGAEIACPKCGAAMVVPELETAEAELAMARSGRGQASPAAETGDPFSEFVVFDDSGVAHDRPIDHTAAANGNGALTSAPGEMTAPRGIGSDISHGRGDEAAERPGVGQPSRPRRSDRQRTSASPPGLGPGAGYGAARQPTFVRSPGSPMLLVSRRVVYVQAVLFGIVAAAAFVSGWLIGRGMPAGAAPDPEAEVAVESVLIQGRISYASEDGEQRRDAGAVLIALPAGTLPDSRLPVQRLGPMEAVPEATSPVLLAIEELGGRYVRADADGHYSLVVPQPGQYRLLIISRHTMRQGGTAVDPQDLDTLGRYFSSAAALIGQQKYALLNENVPAGLHDKSHDFGVSGQL